MLYKSYNELKGKILKYEDKIYFTVNNHIYKYVVTNCFLSNRDYRNSIIFEILKLNKEKFCSKYYGYDPGLGSFPETYLKDYNGLTKVTLALFKLCDNYFKFDIWK